MNMGRASAGGVLFLLHQMEPSEERRPATTHPPFGIFKSRKSHGYQSLREFGIQKAIA
jgi:hypothetical protein